MFQNSMQSLGRVQSGWGGSRSALSPPTKLGSGESLSKTLEHWNKTSTYIYFYKNNNNNKTYYGTRHLAKSTTYDFAPTIDHLRLCSIIPITPLGTRGTNGTNFCAADPAIVTYVTLKTSKTDAAFTELQKPATANDKHHKKHKKSTDLGELSRICEV